MLLQITAIIAIACATFVVGRALVSALKLRRHLASGPYERMWKLVQVLMGVLVVGFLSSIGIIATGHEHLLVVLVGPLFIAGAVFVHAMIRAASYVVSDLMRIESSKSQDRDQQRSSTRIRKHSGTFRVGTGADEDSGVRQAPATILVVEDSQVNSTILSHYLKRLGHLGIVVSDGASAKAALTREKSIELVLLDYWLPDIEGIELLDYLKSLEPHHDTPVIMLSSESDAETIAQCIEAGADDFLPKPFTPRLLEARIEACLGKRRFRSRERDFMARLDRERKRSNELLRVILPDAIADELKRTNQVSPRRYENVAVMFADIAGFTAYCDKHEPEDVLSRLQSAVIAFEKLAEEHGVQKIKTIGDSFMAACGLLESMDNPVLRCVEMGLAMIDALGDTDNSDWQLRIGIHVGPVVAGIVGRRQYLFDIWGDTVNTAHRVEEYSASGHVCVSRDAWNQLQNLAIGESLGNVFAKGKGDIELYRVDGVTSVPRPLNDEASASPARKQLKAAGA